MTNVMIIRIIAAVASIIFGIVALLIPERIADLFSLKADTAEGQAEIRASWGGTFIGLGIAVLYLNTDDAYFVFGIAYAIMALVRSGNWLRDKSLINRTSALIIGFEIISAIIFALPGDIF